jgi:hypothetical protein
MVNWLWTVTPCGQPPVAHTAHSHDDGVVLFSVIKWSCFRLSRFRRNGPSGPLFDNQMGLFWIDKNTRAHEWRLDQVRTGARYGLRVMV